MKINFTPIIMKKKTGYDKLNNIQLFSFRSIILQYINDKILNHLIYKLFFNTCMTNYFIKEVENYLFTL